MCPEKETGEPGSAAEAEASAVLRYEPVKPAGRLLWEASQSCAAILLPGFSRQSGPCGHSSDESPETAWLLWACVGIANATPCSRRQLNRRSRSQSRSQCRTSPFWKFRMKRCAHRS